jgi:hypothetical protein
MSRPNRRRPQPQANHGERQRLVVSALEFGQHRHPARNSIFIRQRVEMPGAGRGSLKLGKVSTVASPARERDALSGEGARVDRRRRQGTRRLALSIGSLNRGEVITQHDHPVPERVGKDLVELKLWCNLLEHLLILRIAAQLVVGKFAQDAETGAGVLFCENDVESDDACLVAIEQLVQHQGQPVPPPGPATLLREALFVDIDDHDPVIHVARHGDAEAGVIDDQFETLDQRDAVVLRSMTNECEHHQHPERNPHQVFLHYASLRNLPSVRSRPAKIRPALARSS